MKTNIASVNATIVKLLFASAVASGIAGCNSSGEDANSALSVTDLELMPVSNAKLMSATEAQVTLTLQNGLYLTATGQSYTCSECEPIVADGQPESSSNTQDYSVTTTQEQGVDESDRVKYDGTNIYLANNGDHQSIWQEDNNDKLSASVRVLHRGADDSLSELAKITTDEDSGYLSELYLHQNVLTMLYDVYEPYSILESDVADSSVFYPSNQQFGLSFHNVEQAQTPQKLAQLKIDGQLISSRRIEDKVYLVSRFSALLPEQIAIPEQQSSAQLQRFYTDVLTTSLQQMLPQIYYQDREAMPLVQAEECYLPERHSANYGFTEITTVTTFDLDNPNEFQSSCVIAPLDGFYSSAENMYLHERYYDEESQNYNTIIHKFAYQEQGVEYKATGSIPGHVSWSNSHLRFSEQDQLLRVLTSQDNFLNQELTKEHRLFVLQESNDQELEIISTLPNEARPQPIGKPDEDIYAVRYFGDKAYVVTFRRIDPLYVLNLSEPTEPFVEGELEIPGYSGYLQPINENFVLGIGQQVDPNAEVGTPIVNEPESDFVEGAKAELYDVSNPNTPKVAATLVYPDSYSVAEWDYRALTQLKVSDTLYKFAFPLGGWSQVSTAEDSVEWSYHQSMQLVELDVSGSGSLTNIGSLSPQSDYYGQWGDRAVLHNDLIYYIRNNQVWQSYWGQPEVLNGPF